MVTEVEFSEKAKHFSNQELREIITRCEDAIADGSAGVEEYEAFVVCQQELARRTWG